MRSVIVNASRLLSRSSSSASRGGYTSLTGTPQWPPTPTARPQQFRQQSSRALHTSAPRLAVRMQGDEEGTSSAAALARRSMLNVPGSSARRSMLYVPGSSDKMIKKSHSSPADCIIFDLEDSVAAHRKGAARKSVLQGLNDASRPGPELAVRINPPSGSLFLASDDLDVVLPCRQLNTIVVPKVESLKDITFLLDKIIEHRSDRNDAFNPLSLVLSIESANSLLQMASIIKDFGAEVRSQHAEERVQIDALLFASEDYCASTGIIRSKSRVELLFPRAHMATIAKAYDLQAIDMVCIDYKDDSYLAEEAGEGRALGYDGKQAIHPAQVDTIQRAFTPGEREIERAAKIKQAYTQSLKQDKGAVGFVEGESMIMIDAPMLKQADAVLTKARAAGATIPDVSVKLA